MATLLAVSEAYALAEQVVNIFNGGKDWVEKAYRNPELANSLAAIFKRFQDELSPLAAQCRDNTLNLSDDYQLFFAVRIEELKQNLHETCVRLQRKMRRLKNPVFRCVRALATSSWLSELETSALHADELLRDIKSCFMTATLITQNAEHVVDAIERQLRPLTDAIAPGDEPDSFRPCFNVPENPSHVVLNFNCNPELEPPVPRRSNPEGHLKMKVLQSNGTQSIAAVGSRLSHLIGTDGMSGVGKSCALRGLAKDPDIRERFRDGIYFITLGKEAKVPHIMGQVEKIVKESGGERAARKIKEDDTFDTSLSSARKWFECKCILLLIDDAWHENECGRGVVSRLSRIVDVECGSRVVFTTRDLRLTVDALAVHFDARDHEMSLQILLASAGLEAEQVEVCKSIVEHVLEFCGGLPMALAVAGCAVKIQLAQMHSATNMRETWDAYLSELQKHREYLLHDFVANDPYENLSMAFATSLTILDKYLTQSLPFQPKMPMSEVYRTLIVLQQQGWIPVTVLELLWDSNDEHEALRMLQALENANLAQRENRILNGKLTPGISLHSLHLTFAQDECAKRGEKTKWHRKLLGKYLPEEDPTDYRSSVKCRDWTKDDIFNEDYIRDNVSRHLVGAGLGEELHCLLMNPKWTAKRLCLGEILQLENDFGVMVAVRREEREADLQPGSDEWCLKILAGAARLSSPFVSRSPAEVWFQLYARLLRRSKRAEAIRVYLEDIERYAEKPWVKALSICLPEPGGVLQSTVICRGLVQWITPSDDGKKLFVCGRGFPDKDSTFFSTIVGGQVEKTVSLWGRNCSSQVPQDLSAFMLKYLNDSEARERFLAGSSSDDDVAFDEDGSSRELEVLGSVLTICCSRDGARVVTGHKSGAVQVWNAETGEAVGGSRHRHRSEVACVALSVDGKRIASGSGYGGVRLWDAASGEPLGRSVRGHSGIIAGIAWSADGKLVASASGDKTVQVWAVETGQTLGSALCGHSDVVVCVAFSTDGGRLASGASDGTVLLWEMREGEGVVDGVLLGHSGIVSCVAFSADSRLVVSGSLDCTLRVWDVRTRGVLQILRGHSNWVQCFAFLGDSTRFASGAFDETVRVWDLKSGAALGDEAGKHGSQINCVAFSPDGKRVAAGVLNGTVHMWDAETGGVIGDGIHVFQGLGSQVWSVGWSGDGKRLAAGSVGGVIRVWDMERGEAVGHPGFWHSSAVVCVALSEDGTRLASGAEDKQARLWEVEGGDCLKIENDWNIGDVGRLRSLLGGKDGAFVDVEEDGRVIFGDKCVKYGGGGDSVVLATLEGFGYKWDYYAASGRIAAGLQSSEGSMHYLELVEAGDKKRGCTEGSGRGGGSSWEVGKAEGVGRKRACGVFYGGKCTCGALQGLSPLMRQREGPFEGIDMYRLMEEWQERNTGSGRFG
ncbi:unnamed protein product [Agarophyton chilense]|eukprot:gb/GEZJ01002519.1/.p1 GENE.gb/GEZJ01002519.1/~~gb/GEZJ01002519.1/.p1  ORF type:complete len:1413 (-),score=155.69 gb/GEZJ01002519.1/:93-4331(-)